MFWSSLGIWFGRLIDDQVTVSDVVAYAVVGGVIIGIVATSIEMVGGRVRQDQPRSQRYRAWKKRHRSKTVEDHR